MSDCSMKFVLKQILKRWMDFKIKIYFCVPVDVLPLPESDILPQLSVPRGDLWGHPRGALATLLTGENRDRYCWKSWKVKFRWQALRPQEFDPNAFLVKCSHPDIFLWGQTGWYEWAIIPRVLSRPRGVRTCTRDCCAAGTNRDHQNRPWILASWGQAPWFAGWSPTSGSWAPIKAPRFPCKAFVNPVCHPSCPVCEFTTRRHINPSSEWPESGGTLRSTWNG